MYGSSSATRIGDWDMVLCDLKGELASTAVTISTLQRLTRLGLGCELRAPANDAHMLRERPRSPPSLLQSAYTGICPPTGEETGRPRRPLQRPCPPVGKSGQPGSARDPERHPGRSRPLPARASNRLSP